MSISPKAVRFDEDVMSVELRDSRTIGVPLAWFPRLLRATSVERKAFKISRRGLHWKALDKGISVAGLLAGQGDRTSQSAQAA